MEYPIRVAHIVGKWVGGGVESVIMNYYKNINREVIQFDFFCDEDSINIPYEEINNLGGKVILIPPYQNILKYMKELDSIFKKNNYQIVHSHINTLSVFPLYIAKKNNIPIRISHSHSTSNKKEWKRTFIKNLLRPFSKINATNYYCCSELAGKWLFGNKFYNKDNVYLLNNAIDLEKFQYNPSVREYKRKELHIHEDTLVIGHVGRFVTQKNHDFLIDIFYEINKQNSNSVLLMAGDGPLKNKIENKVKVLKLENHVKFLGNRLDINELYQVFDVFLLPSLYEGLPVVGIEAQASGLLCVLSDETTKETKCLESTVFLSLSMESKLWSDIILDKINSFTRVNTYEQMTNQHFNIKEEAKKLENKYINYYEGTVKNCRKL